MGATNGRGQDPVAGATTGLSYKDAGVDIDAATRGLSRARRAIVRTHTDGCVGGIGGFGGLFRMPRDMRSPLLVASTDGVGTKVQVARAAGRYDTVGEDLVNHCVNDILVQGAKPLFLLDYFATGRLDEDVLVDVIEGFARGCERNGCALLGGETAEMPGTYDGGDFDVCATVVGAVEEETLLPRPDLAAGDVLIGLRSSGLHTNGYSLARRALLERGGYALDDRPTELGGETVADALLAVHRTYAPLLLPLLPDGDILALAHITGGGFYDNVPRVLPERLAARIDASSWTPLPIFELIRAAGEVAKREMYRTFNMGVGMVLVCRPDRADAVLGALADAGEAGAVRIGVLEPRADDAAPAVRLD